jgi:hypothetical protein
MIIVYQEVNCGLLYTYALNCGKLKSDSSTVQRMTFLIHQTSCHLSDPINLQVTQL